MDVSIIIVNWNTRDLLRDCLNSIIYTTHHVKYEIIVIDNNSFDNSVEMVKKEYPQVKLISNSDNKGFATANNQGMKIAAGRYILLLNPDTVVCKDAIELTMKYADTKPNVAVIGCQVLIEKDKIDMTCFRHPGLLNLTLNLSGLPRIFKYNKFIGRENMLWWKRDCERTVDVVTGMFMFVKRKAIEEVGGMDENFFVYAEEADWCRRFINSGWDNLFWPGAQIIHVHGGGGSSQQAKIKMAVQLKKSLLIYIKKHEGFVSYSLARLLLLLSNIIKMMIRIVTKFINKRYDEKEIITIEIKKNIALVKFCIFNRMPD